MEKKLKSDKKKYYRIKTKSLPRVSFAVISHEKTEKSERVENNHYTLVRYVDTGKVDIAFENGQKITLGNGEYCIHPKREAYDITIYKNTTSTVFSFFIDEGIEQIVDQSEIVLERSDNFKYVDIESLFILLKGKLAPSEKAYYELKQLIHSYDGLGEYVNANASCRAWNFFVELANMQVSAVKGNGSARKSKAELYCDRIDEYIEKNYMQPITMTTVSDLLVLHENYISRVYKQLRGMTVVEHLRNVRIEKAKTLLAQHKHTVAQVSKMVGFQNVKYFIAVFKKVERVSPGKYYHSLFEHRLYTYDLPEYIDQESDEL